MARKVKPEDFLKQIAEVAAGLRRDIEAQVDGFDPDPKASAERRRRGKPAFEYFCRTAFPLPAPGEASAVHTFLFAPPPHIALDPPHGPLAPDREPRG